MDRQVGAAVFQPSPVFHKLWVETKRLRSRIQAAGMSFLRRVAELRHPEGARSRTAAPSQFSW